MAPAAVRWRLRWSPAAAAAAVGAAVAAVCAAAVGVTVAADGSVWGSAAAAAVGEAGGVRMAIAGGARDGGRGGGGAPPSLTPPPPPLLAQPASTSPAVPPPPPPPGLPIPTMAPGCGAIGIEVWRTYPVWPYHCDGWRFIVRYTGCSREASPGAPPIVDAFRLQVWSTPINATGPATLEAESMEMIARGASPAAKSTETQMVPRCAPRSWYAEACVVPAAKGVPACSRSPVIEHPDGLVAAPVVTLVNPFPPRRLALAPGDRVRLSTSVKAVARSWLACAYSLSLKDLRLVTVVRRADNTTRRSAPVLGSSTITTQVVVTTADDGAVVYVEASRKECPAAPTRILSTNTLETGGTILSVSTATPPLVAQDMKPPIVKGILWPPTELGKPVTLTVTATNGGGGGRLLSSATVSTNISYQWLNATRFNAAHEEWAVMDGETGPTLELKFPRPVCFASDCGRLG